jgi:hypothetical protein
MLQLLLLFALKDYTIIRGLTHTIADHGLGVGLEVMGYD